MSTLEKIILINKIVKEFFENPNHPSKVAALEMMPLFVKGGVFKKDNINSPGLPLRKLLRLLDSQGQLSLLPYLHVERKDSNRFWYFVSNPSARIATIEVLQKKNSSKPEGSIRRENSDEYYVIGLCDEILGLKADHQHTFDFLRGDSGKLLNVDAYYEELNLVIEYCESQHTEATPFFDHNDRLTVSGVTRGEQRKIYDERRRTLLPQHGIKLVEIYYNDFGATKRLKRNPERDKDIVRGILKGNGII